MELPKTGGCCILPGYMEDLRPKYSTSATAAAPQSICNTYRYQCVGPSLASHARGSSRALRHQAAVAQVSQGRIRAPKWWVSRRTDASTSTCCSDTPQHATSPKRENHLNGAKRMPTAHCVCANGRSQETLAEELGLQYRVCFILSFLRRQ